MLKPHYHHWGWTNKRSNPLHSHLIFSILLSHYNWFILQRCILYFQSQSFYFILHTVLLLLISSKNIISAASDVSIIESMIQLSSNESNNGQLDYFTFDVSEKKLLLFNKGKRCPRDLPNILTAMICKPQVIWACLSHFVLTITYETADNEYYKCVFIFNTVSGELLRPLTSLPVKYWMILWSNK